MRSPGWSVVAVFAAVACLTAAGQATAGFSGKDLIVPGVARTQGNFGSAWYTTLWVTNLGASMANVEIRFYKKDQANTSPLSRTDTLSPGQTKRYDNIVGDLFGQTGVLGALRVLSDRELMVSSRTFDLHGSDPAESRGHFFGGLPPSVAIGVNESTRLQGLTQAGSENFRYNFGIVETTGQNATVRVTLRDPAGTILGAPKDYAMRAFEVKQVGINDVWNAVATTNAVLDATVVSGSGKVILYGTQIPNGSSDSCGFEMLFAKNLLAASDGVQAEGMSASASATSTAVVDKVVTIMSTAALLGSWDDATKWWTVSVNLRNDYSATLQVQFRDITGQPQKLYLPYLVDTVEVKGQAQGAGGTVSFDIVIVGIGQGSDSFRVSGYGTVVFQGISATYTLASLVQPKSASYPSSGTVTVAAAGVVVSVSFNGTSVVHGTYTVGLITMGFTIDLATGEVTHP
jgi:hypothetical protein